MVTYSPSIYDAGAGGSGFQGQPWLQSEFKVIRSLSYTRPCFRKQKQKQRVDLSVLAWEF